MNYAEVTNDVVRRIQEAGAEGEAYIAAGVETQIQVRAGKVEKLSYAGSKGLGVRAIQDGKMGYAFTSDFSSGSVEKAVQGALELMEAVDADEYRSIPEPQPIPEEDLKIFDPAMLKMDPEDKVAFAIDIERGALEADPRVVMTLFTQYLDAVVDVYLANSRGFAGSYKKSLAVGMIQAVAVEGDEKALAFNIGSGTSMKELDALEIGRYAGQQAARLLGGKPVATQQATVVYSSFAAAGLLGALSRALTAEAMQRSRSFLVGKMGQDVAADVVSLLDNGRLPGGLATRPFDDEGVPTRATRLIDEGVLQAVLYDSYTAEKDGTDSSGNATRGSHRDSPVLSPSNFYIQPGPESPETLIAGVEKGLYVVNTMNDHNINPVNGDYSVSAQGFWIENGQMTVPVNNVTIALPLDQLLKNVRAVANDLIFLPFGGAIGSPTFRVDDVMIAGEGS
jgi:PmbA protein